VSVFSLGENRCIFGEEIVGWSIAAEPKEHFVSLRKAAWGKVNKEYGEKTKVEIYRECFSDFCGKLGTEISGSRLCAYPREGYHGTERGLDKSPVKSGKHAPRFDLVGAPALCFEDIIKTTRGKVLLAKAKIEIVKLT
jgi:hypothetical protein